MQGGRAQDFGQENVERRKQGNEKVPREIPNLSIVTPFSVRFADTQQYSSHSIQEKFRFVK